MKEQPIKRILKHLAEQAVPSDLDLWPAISARLKARPTSQFNSSVKGETLMNAPILKQRRFRLFALSALVVLLVAATFATPWGKAFAQSLFQFFAVAEGDSFPLPTEQIALYNNVPTVAPTFAAQLKPIETEEPPAPAPTRDPYYSLTVSEAEAQAGFDVLEPAYLPPYFTFRGAAYDPDRRVVTLVYKYDGGLGRDRVGIYIGQQRLSDYDPRACPSCQIGPSAVVQTVRIGNVTGEYVGGAWRGPQATSMPGASATPEMVWDPTPFFRTVGWQEEEMRFTVQGIGPAADGELPGNLSKDTLVEIATSMTMCRDTLASLFYRCQVSSVEAAVGFDAKEPPDDIPGLVFERAEANPTLGVLGLHYKAIGGGTELIITQSRTDLVALGWGEVPLSANVEKVKIGQYDGEYVQGTFIVRPGATSAVWEPNAPVQRLRWREGNRLFGIDMFGRTASVEYLGKEALIALAESLVYAPNIPEGQLRAEYLTNVQDAEVVAGFDLQEPTILPEGFAFKYADYDTQTRRIRMVYEFGSQSGVAGLIIFQTPITAATDINLADGRTPGTVEQVAIGTTTGHYVPREGGAPQALVWRTNDLQIEMYFFPSQWYSGRLEKADMVAIAESMK